MDASDAKVMKEGVDMLRDGFKIAMGGKETIEKGIAMNDQVAKSKGIVDKFADGNKIMQDGMATMARASNFTCGGTLGIPLNSIFSAEMIFEMRGQHELYIVQIL